MTGENKSKKYQYFRIVGIILFFYIISRINLQELFLTFKNINLFYFFLAVFLLPFSPLLGILKWKILIDSQDMKISFWALVRPSLKGLFWGTITPGRLGELWRAKYLTNIADISGGKAFYTVLMDRLIDLVIAIMVGIAGVANLFLFNKAKTGWSIVIMLSVSAIFIIYFLVRRENAKKTLKLLFKFFLPASLKNKTNSFFDEFFQGMEKLSFCLFLKLLGWGFLYYLMTVLIYYSLALSLGISIAFFHLFLIVALAWLVLILPVTVFGLGTREASYIFLFSVFNIPASPAVGFSILVLFIGILLSIPGAALFLRKKQRFP